MTPVNRSGGAVVALAACSAVAAFSAWQWQRHVDRGAPAEQVKADAWEHVKTQYPVPESLSPAPALSAELFQAVVGANPFSPQRRAASAAGSAGRGATIITPKATAPQFAYKGRIDLGSRQRAILEDQAAKKTYFLEVGQEVAGFKVLDISESQVLLSDPKSQEPLAIPLASKSGP
jgi:hypothetical protein